MVLCVGSYAVPRRCGGLLALMRACPGRRGLQHTASQRCCLPATASPTDPVLVPPHPSSMDLPHQHAGPFLPVGDTVSTEDCRTAPPSLVQTSLLNSCVFLCACRSLSSQWMMVFGTQACPHLSLTSITHALPIRLLVPDWCPTNVGSHGLWGDKGVAPRSRSLNPLPRCRAHPGRRTPTEVT